MKKSWKTLSSKVVHKNPYWQVRQDKVIKPNGEKGTYSKIDQDDFVCICPVDDNGKSIHLVRFWRYVIKKNSWEVPMGYIDKGEAPLQAAKRELAEEAGLKATKWKKIGVSYLANGLSNQKFHIFLAQDFKTVEKNLDAGEADMISKKLSLKKVEAMIKSGELDDSPTITSIYYLNLYLKK